MAKYLQHEVQAPRGARSPDIGGDAFVESAEALLPENRGEGAAQSPVLRHRSCPAIVNCKWRRNHARK